MSPLDTVNNLGNLYAEDLLSWLRFTRSKSIRGAKKVGRSSNNTRILRTMRTIFQGITGKTTRKTIFSKLAIRRTDVAYPLGRLLHQSDAQIKSALEQLREIFGRLDDANEVLGRTFNPNRMQVYEHATAGEEGNEENHEHPEPEEAENGDLFKT